MDDDPGGEAPQRLCIWCPARGQQPELTGVYEQQGKHNSQPVWVRDGAKLYSDSAGCWRLRDSDSAAHDVGWYRSAPHHDDYPHRVTEWERTSTVSGAAMSSAVWESAGLRVTVQRPRLPQCLRVRGAVPGALCGLYEHVSGTNINPEWEHGAGRIFADPQGRWRLCLKEGDAEAAVGSYRSRVPHGGLTPDEVSWDVQSAQGQWDAAQLNVLADDSAAAARRAVTPATARKAMSIQTMKAAMASYMERCRPVGPIASLCAIGVAFFAVAATLFGTLPGDETSVPQECFNFTNVTRGAASCAQFGLAETDTLALCEAAAGWMSLARGGTPHQCNSSQPPVCFLEASERKVVWHECNATRRPWEPERSLVCRSLQPQPPASCAFDVSPSQAQAQAANIFLVLGGVAVAAVLLCVVAPGQGADPVVTPMETMPVSLPGSPMQQPIDYRPPSPVA